MQASSIKRGIDNKILIVWSNGHQSNFVLEHLRSICPCASCSGEDVLLQHYSPQPIVEHPERFNLVGVEPVGSYAVRLQWGDGHDAGIYTWEHLLKNCPCSNCGQTKK